MTFLGSAFFEGSQEGHYGNYIYFLCHFEHQSCSITLEAFKTAISIQLLTISLTYMTIAQFYFSPHSDLKNTPNSRLIVQCIRCCHFIFIFSLKKDRGIRTQTTNFASRLAAPRPLFTALCRALVSFSWTFQLQGQSQSQAGKMQVLGNFGFIQKKFLKRGSFLSGNLKQEKVWAPTGPPPTPKNERSQFGDKLVWQHD